MEWSAVRTLHKHVGWAYSPTISLLDSEGGRFRPPYMLVGATMRTLRRWIKGSIVVLLTSLSLATAVVGVGSRGRSMWLTHNAYSVGPNQLEVLNENEVSVTNGLFQFSHNVTSPPYNGANDYETNKADSPWSTYLSEYEPPQTSNPMFSFERTSLPYGGYDRYYWFCGLQCAWGYHLRIQDVVDQYLGTIAKGDERAWQKTWGVAASWWYLSILTAVYPCWCFARRLARRFHPAVGFCQACGYDLRASPHRCPECGTVRRAPTT
ncbi:MAG: hypothetical protein JWL69_2489 [Phycisphaerales bacterium]|nr:hypothetical protein [Phycisphaerales bacterium]